MLQLIGTVVVIWFTIKALIFLGECYSIGAAKEREQKLAKRQRNL
jgi:hypothetical protein